MKKVLQALRENFLPYQGPKAIVVVALYLVATVSLFFEDYLEESFYTLLIVTLGFGSFLLLLIRQEFRRIKILDYVLLPLIVAFFVTVVFSKVWYWSLLSFLRLTSFLVLFYLVISFVQNKKQRWSLFYFLILVSFISTLIGFNDFFLSEKPLVAKRFYGTIHMHVFAGGYLLLIIPLVFVLFLYAGSRKESLLWGNLSFLFILALFLTFARGAWLALLLQLLLVLVLARRALWKKKFSTLAIFGAVFAAAIFVSSPELILGRISSVVLVGDPVKSARLQPGIPYDTGAIHRLDNYKNSLRIFKDHPFFGIGLKNYGFVYHQYQDKPWIYSSVSHSSYLDFLAETGLIGVLGIISFVLVCFWLLKPYLWPVIKNPRPHVFGLALFGGIFGSLIHMGIDSDLSIPAIFLTLLLELGLLISWVLESRGSMGSMVVKEFSFRPKLLLSLFLLSGILLSITFAYAVFYFQKAQIAAKSGDFDQALNLYKKSLKLNPSLPFTYENIGSLFYERGDPKTSIWYLKKAVELNPFYPEHTFNLALAQAALGENGKAEEFFKKTLELGPYTTPRYYNAFAQFYLSLGREEQAREVYEEAVEHFPYTQAFVSYAGMYSSMKKHILESYLSLAALEEEAGNLDKSEELIKEAQLFLETQ